MKNSRETPDQRTRRLRAARLNATWPNTRPSPRPRGLQRTGNGCYRNSALQMLTHMPKFVNWIMEHNEDGQNWPCNPNDPNLRYPHLRENDKVLTQLMNKDFILGCVLCRLKEFFRDYWTDASTNPQNHPTSFQENRASIAPIHRMGEKWFCTRVWWRAARGQKKADAMKLNETDDEFVLRLHEEETPRARDERYAAAVGQQCSDEFIDTLLEQVHKSIHPDNEDRLADYDALFSIHGDVEVRCRTCNHIAFLPPEDPNRGISRVPFARSGRDDLASAIARHDFMNLYEPEKTCDETNCQQKGANKIRQITAAPHYLRVHLDLFSGDHNLGDNRKNRNGVQIPPILNITQHAKAASADEPAWPMRYKLISAIYHSGTTSNHGHNTAGVSRPLTKAEQQHCAKRVQDARKARAAKASGQPAQSTGSRKRKRQEPAPSTGYYLCDDSRVAHLPATGDENPLCRNPMTGPIVEDANVAVLMYERLPHRTPRYLSELKTALAEDGYYAIGSGAPKEKKIEEEKKDEKEEEIEKEGAKSGGGGGDGDSGEEKDAEEKNTEKLEIEKKTEGEKKAEEKKKGEEEKPEGRYPKRRRKAVSYGKMCW